METEAPTRLADHVKSSGGLRVKAQVHQIVWHSDSVKETPVFGVSLCPRMFGTKYLLASAGANKLIGLWAVILVDDGEQGRKTQVMHIRYIEHHKYSVNCVKFSPDGHMMASGSDGGEIAVWKHENVDDMSGWKHGGSLKYFPLSFFFLLFCSVVCVSDITFLSLSLSPFPPQLKSTGGTLSGLTSSTCVGRLMEISFYRPA